ncbi:dihydrolipoyl dehydrogenase [Candidatus Omnitrophota bacterium]
MKNKYDYLVIGSGPAGHVSAIRAAQLGMKVAIVEKDPAMLGGVCLNEGCIPAKSLYHSAEILDIVRKDAALCGLDVKCGPVDASKFVKKSREDAEQLKKGLTFLFKKNGIDVIEGFARFIDSGTVEISGKNGDVSEVKAEKFLIATGSVPRQLPGVPFDGKRILSSSHAIRMQDIPKKILIVGGGYIGTEFASYFNILGSEVTVVEALGSILATEDSDISRRMQIIFKQRGIEVLAESKVEGVTAGESSVTVTIGDDNGGETVQLCDMVIVSVGRDPVASDIGLEKAGVETDDRGFIVIDENMRTSVKNIFAAGDVTPGPMLAHSGYAEGEAAAETAAGNDPEPVDFNCVPRVVYTDIQVARVGMTEDEARDQKLEYSVGKQFFKANGKAVVISRTEGFIKIVADNKTREFLGAHIIGHDAADLIHEFAVAKRAGLSVDEVAKTVHAHPTISEAAVDACKSVFGKPIHG